jgi:hypothetical protein
MKIEHDGELHYFGVTFTSAPVVFEFAFGPAALDRPSPTSRSGGVRGSVNVLLGDGRVPARVGGGVERRRVRYGVEAAVYRSSVRKHLDTAIGYGGRAC